MLVLLRKVGEEIRIGDNITLTVVRIQGDKVRLGIQAPDDVKVYRSELLPLVEGTAEHAAPKGQATHPTVQR